MPDLHLVDVSEWQGSIDWPAYAKARQAAIVRVSVDLRADRTMPGRRDELRRSGVRVRGWYHYLTGSDARAQARIFAAQVGSLQPGEFAVLDVEEPTLPDPVGAARAFLAEAERLLGATCWIYSGAYFWRDRLRSGKDLGPRPLWVAAYGQAEPAAGQVLWQHTSGSTEHPGMPGPVDCSIFHGSIDQLYALTTGGADVPLTDAEISRIADTVVERVAIDSTHPYTISATGAATAARLDALAKAVAALAGQVSKVAAGGVDPAAVAALVVAELGDRLQTPPKP